MTEMKYLSQIPFTDSEEIAGRWKEYFCDLLNLPNSQDKSDEENDFRIGAKDEENPTTLEKFKKAISWMKKVENHLEMMDCQWRC